MLTLRFLGETQVTSWPSRRTRPESASSKPAITRSVVVFPQPLGPEHREELARRGSRGDVVDRADVAEVLDQAVDARSSAPRSLVLLPITIANRSLTLVPVGPVTSASSSAARRHRRAVLEQRRAQVEAELARRARRWRRRRSRRRASVPPSEPSVSRKIAATGGALELERGGDRRLLVRAAVAEGGVADRASRCSRRRSRACTVPGANGAAVGGAVAGEVGRAACRAGAPRPRGWSRARPG